MTVVDAGVVEVARVMLELAVAAGVVAWVVGDRVDGSEDLRRWLEARRQPYALAVASTHGVWRADGDACGGDGPRGRRPAEIS